MVGGLTTAAVGWLVVTGLVVCGWLMGEDSALPTAFELGTRLWLLAGGVPVVVGGLSVSLVPWGVTVLTAAMLWRFGAYAARRVRPAPAAPPGLARATARHRQPAELPPERRTASPASR